MQAQAWLLSLTDYIALPTPKNNFRRKRELSLIYTSHKFLLQNATTLFLQKIARKKNKLSDTFSLI